MNKKQEITTPQTTGLTLMGGLTASDLENLDVEKVKALLEMQVKISERAAEQSLAASLAEFQQAAPAVHKDTKGGQGNYATFDAIMGAIRPALADNGLSVSFDTEQGDGGLTATCHVMHRDGATFVRKATVPVDSQMRCNDAQKMGSAISYAKRYALTAALNIVTTDDDDDGEAAGTDTVTQEQADKLRELLDQVMAKDEKNRFWAWLEVKKPDDIPAAKMRKATEALNRILKKQHENS